MSNTRTVADLGELGQGLFFLLLFPALVAWVVFLSIVEGEDLRDEVSKVTVTQWEAAS